MSTSTRSFSLLLSTLWTALFISASLPAQDTAKAADATPKTAIDKQIELVHKYRKARQYDRCLTMLQKLLDENAKSPELAKLKFELGQVYFSRSQAAREGKVNGVDFDGGLKKAIALFQDVVKNHTEAEKAADASYMTGSTYLLLEDLTNARQHYKFTYDRFKQFKRRSKALLRMGVCQAGLGESKQALATYYRVIREAEKGGSDYKKATKYIREMGLVGKKPQFYADEWLLGSVGPEGLATFEGQVIVLVFFATWCNHCANNMPRLRELIDQMQAEGVVFLGVANPNDPQNTEPVDVYVQKKQLSFLDVALDSQWRSWRSFRVSGLPASVVIDAEGVVRWRGNLSFLPTELIDRLNREAN